MEWDGRFPIACTVEYPGIAKKNICNASALVQLVVGRRIEGNVLDIQQMNLILLEGQRKQQNILCLSRRDS